MSLLNFHVIILRLGFRIQCEIYSRSHFLIVHAKYFPVIYFEMSSLYKRNSGIVNFMYLSLLKVENCILYMRKIWINLIYCNSTTFCLKIVTNYTFKLLLQQPVFFFNFRKAWKVLIIPDLTCSLHTFHFSNTKYYV